MVKDLNYPVEVDHEQETKIKWKFATVKYVNHQ
jgi:hypothetical protein